MSPRGVLLSCGGCAASGRIAWRASRRAAAAHEQALQLEDHLDRARREIYELEKELTALRSAASDAA